MCSRVCGIGPSVAATTRIAPSICAAGACDHVLDVVGVPGAVDVRVVALGGLVLDVGRVAIVMPRSRSSGALSMASKAIAVPPLASARTLVIAAVRVVLPWSTWPMVPTLTWGLVR